MLLETYGELPSKYRLLIWRTLLRLPHNRLAYNGLRGRGTHPAFADLRARFPGLAPTLCARLARTLSCLTWWAPVLAEDEHAPALVFPFVKLFHADDLGAFEAIAAVLLNVLPGWFETFPSPPMRLLAVAEQVLAQHDFELSRHTDAHLGGCWRCAWFLLRSAFSECLEREDWLKVWDHLLLGPPALAVCMAAALLMHCRAQLLAVRSPAAAELLLRTSACCVSVDTVLQSAYKLAAVHCGERWKADPVALGCETTYPPLAPVPDAEVARAAAASEAQRARELLVQRSERLAHSLTGRVDRTAAMQRAWEQERDRMQAVRAERSAAKEALEQGLAARAATAQAEALEARARALDARNGATQRHLLREKEAWNAQLSRLARDVSARHAELHSRGAAAKAEARLGFLEAEADLRDSAADAASAHAAARRRLQAETEAAAAASRLRAARFARQAQVGEEQGRVARAHAESRRGAMAAARQEALAFAAARQAELQLQLAEEDAVAGAMRERVRREAALTEAALTAAQAEAELQRSAAAASAHAARAAAAAAADSDAFRSSAQRRIAALAAAREASLQASLERESARFAMDAAARASQIDVALAERRAALAAADAQAEAEAQRALSLGAAERSRDAAMHRQLMVANVHVASPVHPAVGGDLTARIERARVELAKAAREAEEAEETAEALRQFLARE